MCGIICSWGFPNDNFNKSLESIRHRGPDGQGFSAFHIGTQSLILGHVRLSILDLDERSGQPFSVDNVLHLSFNGEIYNYKELASEFLAGVNLTTDSDTEVLWWLLKKHGLGILDKVNGMFAFVLFNQKTGDLTLVRDSLGIKPLYISTLNDGRIAIGSEIKAIQVLGIEPIVSRRDVAEYIQFGFINEPSTGFDNIKKISPGEIRTINLTSNVTTKTQIDLNKRPQDNIDKIVETSIKIHQRADVPQCLFFSGGVDSSVLLTHMRENHVTPIIWTNDRKETKEAGFTNDSDYARAICAELSLDYVEVSQPKTSASFLQDIRDVAVGVEELIGDYTYIASRDLCQEARKNDFIVAQSGMGADEMFGGYSRYLAFKYIARYSRWLQIITPLLKLIKSKKSGRLMSAILAKEIWNKYFSLISVFSSNEIEELLGSELLFDLEKHKKTLWQQGKLDSNLKTAMNCDRLGFLSHNFIVADKSSMQASVEMRVPLVTQEIYKWFLSATDDDLVKRLELKSSLRAILYKGLNPSFFRRKKAGFNPPLDPRIRELGEEQIVQVLEDSPIFEYINAVPARRIVEKHFDTHENNSYKIFNLLYLAEWLKHYQKRDFHSLAGS